MITQAISRNYGTQQENRMKIAAVGVHVLDTHVIGIESIPTGSDGQLVETIRMSPAGTAGGTAVVLSRLGAEVRRSARSAPTRSATCCSAAARREGVDVSGLVRKDDHQTSASVIPVRPERRPPGLALHRRQRRLHPRRPAARGARRASRTCTWAARSSSAARPPGSCSRTAARSAPSTSLDILAPGDPDMLAWIADALPHTDYLLPNDEQVLGFTGAASLVEGARALVAAGVGCVAVTQGAKGALVVTADEVIEVPAYAVDVVDTTGCGDAFSAGFLRGLSLGRDLRGAAELGCATAAQVAQGLGTDAGSYALDSVVALRRGGRPRPTAARVRPGSCSSLLARAADARRAPALARAAPRDRVRPGPSGVRPVGARPHDGPRLTLPGPSRRPAGDRRRSGSPRPARLEPAARSSGGRARR